MLDWDLTSCISLVDRQRRGGERRWQAAGRGGAAGTPLLPGTGAAVAISRLSPWTAPHEQQPAAAPRLRHRRPLPARQVGGRQPPGGHPGAGGAVGVFGAKSGCSSHESDLWKSWCSLTQLTYNCNYRSNHVLLLYCRLISLKFQSDTGIFFIIVIYFQAITSLKLNIISYF